MASAHTYQPSSTTGDVTIDIPLTKYTTSKSTGRRQELSPQQSQPYSNPLSEKPRQITFHQHNDSEGGGRGRRRRLEANGYETRKSGDGSTNVLGKFYRKVYNASVITRYLLYVLPLAICIAIPIIVGATVDEPATIGGVQITWFFIWIEVLWCSLWVSKLVAKALPYVFQTVVGVVSSGTRKYSAVITSLEIPLSLIGWALTSLCTFVPLMTLNPYNKAHHNTELQEWETIVKNILFACLFSTIVLFLEKLVIQLISISYHRKQFDERIKNSKHNIYLVGLLYDASRKLFPPYCHEFEEEDYTMADVLDIGMGSRHGHKRSGSATPMNLIRNAARMGDKVTAAFGNMAQEVTGKKVFDVTSAHSVVIEALERKRSSEALAKRLWYSFVLEGNEALYEDDIKDVMGSGYEAEAVEAFAILDVDGNGDISLDEMILRLHEFGQTRKSITHSMHDVDQAINVLDNLLCFVVFIITVFIFVAWLNSSFFTTLATAGTALLSLSFVFATTCQEVLGSCIFLFVKHPYDVGDRVDVSDVPYVVERISLLYTVFRRVQDGKIAQVPNIVLNTLFVDNVSRSKAMFERLPIYVSFDTTFDDIELLRAELQKFVADPANARDFQPNIELEILGLGNMDKMQLQVEIRHKSNWHNDAVRAARRNKFLCALITALRKVPIYAPGGGSAAPGEPANPTYSVTISNAEAEVNKAQYAADKEHARMIPSADLDKLTVADSATATGANVFGGSPVDARERAQSVAALTRRSPSNASKPADASMSPTEAQLQRQRSNDIEEVRNVLRRESTTKGRRKRGQQDALSLSTSNVGGSLAFTPSDLRRFPTVEEPGSAAPAYQLAEAPHEPYAVEPPPSSPQTSARLASHESSSRTYLASVSETPVAQNPRDRVSYYQNGPPEATATSQIPLPPSMTQSPYAPQPLSAAGSDPHVPVSSVYPPRSASQTAAGRSRGGSDAQRWPVDSS